MKEFSRPIINFDKPGYLSVIYHNRQEEYELVNAVQNPEMIRLLNLDPLEFQSDHSDFLSIANRRLVEIETLGSAPLLCENTQHRDYLESEKCSLEHRIIGFAIAKALRDNPGQIPRPLPQTDAYGD